MTMLNAVNSPCAVLLYSYHLHFCSLPSMVWFPLNTFTSMSNLSVNHMQLAATWTLLFSCCKQAISTTMISNQHPSVLRKLGHILARSQSTFRILIGAVGFENGPEQETARGWHLASDSAWLLTTRKNKLALYNHICPSRTYQTL